MIHRTIQGDEVPALGLGTWQFTDGCREGVADALDLGYRHLDTAQAYENEDQVGQGLRDSGARREEVFLTTKIWPANLAPDAMRRTTEESLRTLRTDYVDLLLIHWPAGDFDMDASLETLAELQEAGQARHIGVCNFTPDLLEEALERAPLFCIQVEYHPFLAQHELRRLARRHDLLFTAYSPLARGAVLDDELLQAIGEAHGKSTAQVALRWLLQQDRVAAIPKASTAEHRRSNFDVFDFELSEEEMDSIFELAHGKRIIQPDALAPAGWR